MQLTINETIDFLTFLTSDEFQNVLDIKSYLNKSHLFTSEDIDEIKQQLEKTFDDYTTNLNKGDEALTKTLLMGRTFVEAITDKVFADWFASLQLPLVEQSRSKFETLYKTNIKKVNDDVFKAGVFTEQKTSLPILKYSDFNAAFNNELAKLIESSRATFLDSTGAKSAGDKPVDAIAKLAELTETEKQDNRSYLKMAFDGTSHWVTETVSSNPKVSTAISTALIGTGGSIALGLGWWAVLIGAGSAATFASVYRLAQSQGLHFYQDLSARYEHYAKIKPLFQTDDDKQVLKALKNRSEDFTADECNRNEYKVAQAQIILANLPPNELIKTLNIKILGLEQQIWQLVVQPGIDWDREHRQSLQQMMGLLLVIEQTNKELSVFTLEKSDAYQTNDAWWKIISVASSLIPGLLVKFAALNYLSSWFGDSSHIEAKVGKGIMDVVGYLTKQKTFDEVKDTEPTITVTHNSSENSVSATGIMLTSGLAIETLSMVVATRIAYLNYSSATDAYKKMIEDAEKSATHVVDRCTKLIGERLNQVDRSMALVDETRVDLQKNTLYKPLEVIDNPDKQQPQETAYDKQKRAAKNLWSKTVKPAFRLAFPKSTYRSIEKDLPPELVIDDQDEFDGSGGPGTVVIYKKVVEEQDASILLYALCHETGHCVTAAKLNAMKLAIPSLAGESGKENPGAKQHEYIADLIAIDVIKTQLPESVQGVKDAMESIKDKLGNGGNMHPTGNQRMLKMNLLLDDEKTLDELITDIINNPPHGTY